MNSVLEFRTRPAARAALPMRWPCAGADRPRTARPESWLTPRQAQEAGVSTGLVRAVRPYFALAGERRMGTEGAEGYF